MRPNKYLKIGSGVNPEFRDKRGKFIVYFLLRGKRIVYIGRTQDIQQRIAVHKSTLWVKQWFSTCRIIECKTFSKMCKYEERLINLFKPKYNGRKRPCGDDLTNDQFQSIARKNGWYFSEAYRIANKERYTV